ncbi:MAG: hypothetical protein ACYC0X_31490 [Pirellulaceae bacterium]
MISEDSSWVRALLKKMIQVRLLAAGKSPAKSDLDKALRRYFAEQTVMPAAQWQELLTNALHDLQAEGSIDVKPFHLTDTGRADALGFLCIESLPAGITWQTLRNRYLIAKALCITPQSKSEWEQLSSADGLRAAVLAMHHQLPLGAVPTPARVLHALAWLQLKRAHGAILPLDKDFTRNSVLGVTLLEGRSSNKPEEGLAARAVGASSSHPDKLREAVICNWLRRNGSLDDMPLFDLRAFATKVRQLASSSTTGRFGEHKVFISHVWNRFQQDPAAAGMTREEFNNHLVAANRENLLTLSRADLISGMDPADVQQSEIRLPHSSFHFVRTDQ